MLKEFYINAQRFLVLFSEEFGDYCLYCDYNGNLVIVDNHVEDIVEAKIMAHIYMYGFNKGRFFSSLRVGHKIFLMY